MKWGVKSTNIVFTKLCLCAITILQSVGTYTHIIMTYEP